MLTGFETGQPGAMVRGGPVEQAKEALLDGGRDRTAAAGAHGNAVDRPDRCDFGRRAGKEQLVGQVKHFARHGLLADFDIEVACKLEDTVPGDAAEDRRCYRRGQQLAVAHHEKVLTGAFADQTVDRQSDALAVAVALGLAADEAAGQIVAAGLGQRRDRVGGGALPRTDRRIDTFFHCLLTEIAAPVHRGNDHFGGGVVVGDQPDAAVTAKHDRTDVGRFELVFDYGITAGGEQRFPIERHRNAVNARRIEQAMDVLLETECRGAVGGGVDTNALEYAGTVMQRVAEHVHVRFAPRFEAAVLPDVSAFLNCHVLESSGSVGSSDFRDRCRRLFGRAGVAGGTIENFDEGPHAGGNDVGGHAAPGEVGAVDTRAHLDLGLGILALGERAQTHAFQLEGGAGRARQRLEGGIDRAVAGGRFAVFDVVRTADGYRGTGQLLLAEAAGGVEMRQRPRPGRIAALADHQCLDIGVEYLALAIGQLLEAAEQALQFGVADAEAEFSNAIGQGMATGMLAQHQRRSTDADIFRAHDFVGLAVGQHAVLVYAGFVREGVVADNRLVARHEAADHRGQLARYRVKLARVDGGLQVEQVVAGFQRHDHFFQRGIAGALANAAYRAFDLAGARAHRGQAVGYGQAEVVVTVGRDHHPVDAVYIAAQPADACMHFFRGGVADRIGYVDGACTGLDHCSHDFIQEFRLGADRVLCRKLDVIAVLARTPDAIDGACDDFGPGQAQLVLAVDRTGGDEYMDPAALGRCQGAGGKIDIPGIATRQRTDPGAADEFGNLLDGVEILLRRRGETSLDDIDAKLGKASRQTQFLSHAHAATGRLLAVAQRGVEDGDVLAHASAPSTAARGRIVKRPASARPSCGLRRGPARSFNRSTAATSCSLRIWRASISGHRPHGASSSRTRS